MAAFGHVRSSTRRAAWRHFQTFRPVQVPDIRLTNVTAGDDLYTARDGYLDLNSRRQMLTGV